MLSTPRLPRAAHRLCLALLAAALATGCLCEDAEDKATPDAYLGLHGTLYSGGSTCGATCAHATGGVVRVSDAASGDLVTEATADGNGNFEVPLPAGRYHLEAEIDGSDLVDAGDYEVATQGWLITRVIAETWQPGVLAIHFATTATAADQDLLFAEYGLTLIPAGSDGGVRVSCDGDARALVARLLAEHPLEVLAAELNYYVCSAPDGGEWPLHEPTSQSGSSGGSHHHHHHHHHHF